MKKFEERLNRLETLAAQIQDENLPLEEAVAIFEEGIKLAQGLEKELQKLENRVEILLNAPDGSEAEEPRFGLFESSDED